MNPSADESSFQQPRDYSLRQTNSETSTEHPHSTLPRRSHSERLPYQRSPLLDHDLPPLPRPEMSPEDRRQSMVALDRKRRLTSSAYDQGRRRTTTGGFTSRDNRYHPPNGRRNSQRSSSDQREVIDLTSSSPVQEDSNSALPVPVPTPTRITRTPSNGSRGYVVPKWQPDAEVSECPICHRQFGFLFRRHHCRKCGRVVCNDCSPHRITIPRQYIVHPLGTDELSGSPSDAPVIDLTSLEDDEDERYLNPRNYHRRPSMSLGGGEKVRLCNPCVPDPQPELQAVLREGPSRTYSNTEEPLRSAPPGLTSFPQYPRRHGDRQIFGSLPHPGTRLLFGNDEVDTSDSSPEAYPSASRWMATMVSNQRQARLHNANQQTQSGRPPLPISNQRPSPNAPAHSRYYSLDSRQAPLPPLPPLAGFGHQPLDQSMLDSLSRAYGLPPRFDNPATFRPQHPHQSTPSASASTSQPQRMTRPRIREEDICPICRHMLPPKGPDNDETDRENHIMQCISQHDPTAIASSSAPSSSLPTHPRTQTFGNSGPTLQMGGSPAAPTPAPPPPQQQVTHMVRFVATEKDCGPKGVDEQLAECSICMVEYEIGDRLVRLECWCKFHEECIVEWFGRKAECPVHKLS